MKPETLLFELWVFDFFAIGICLGYLAAKIKIRIMKNKKMPETSLEAYRSLEVDDLNKTYQGIITALQKIGEGTFEDIAATMRVNSGKVWRRMGELMKKEIVYRPGNKRVLKSGRKGFTWMLTSDYLQKTEKHIPKAMPKVIHNQPVLF